MLPNFELGETLLGIVVDWSDAEINGLGQAVGKDLATKLLCGCKVHCMGKIMAASTRSHC